MSFVENVTITPDLKEEISYHASERNYHMRHVTLCLEEAVSHLMKAEEHRGLELELTFVLQGKVTLEA